MFGAASRVLGAASRVWCRQPCYWANSRVVRIPTAVLQQGAASHVVGAPAVLLVLTAVL